MKLALLSAAHTHTPGYLKTIRADDDLELVAVWDDMAARGQAAAQEMSCRFDADLEAALDGVDAAVICSDNAGHRPLLEACAERGIHVFCEKPMALTVEDADAMVAAVQRSGIVAVFGYMQPFTGEAQTVRRALESGDLGDVTHVRFRNAHHAAYGHWFDTEEKAWFHDPAKAGGGAFLDMGTHAVHFVRTVFGPVKSVSAVIENKSGIYPQVDDYGIALLEFASGITGVVEASWVFTGGPRGLEVIGSGGRLEMDGGVRLTPFDGQPGQTQSLPPGNGQPARLERLVAILRDQLSKSAADEDLSCSRDAVAVMAAAYQSHRQGRRVTL